jgi:phosphohistidine phosphatase
MMKICLLRHAKAEPAVSENLETDAARVLTPEGTRKMRQIAAGMKAMDLTFDLILSSPFARARQTAEIAAQVLGLSDRLKFTENLTTVAQPSDIVAEICERYRATPSLLLVGHEPFLGQLASLLLTGQDILGVDFKKAGLLALSVEELKRGRCAVLDWFLTPKQLAALA